MNFYRWTNKDLVLFVRVQARASRAEIVGVQHDRLKVKVTAAPVDGRANADVSKLLAKTFGVGKSQVVIQSGHSCRDKRLYIKSPQKLPVFITPFKSN